MSRLKGSAEELELHIRGWFRSEEGDNLLKRNGLRCGQFLWNMLGQDNTSWPELFYEPFPHNAIYLARQEFQK